MRNIHIQLVNATVTKHFTRNARYSNGKQKIAMFFKYPGLPGIQIEKICQSGKRNIGVNQRVTFYTGSAWY